MVFAALRPPATFSQPSGLHRSVKGRSLLFLLPYSLISLALFPCSPVTLCLPISLFLKGLVMRHLRFVFVLTLLCCSGNAFAQHPTSHSPKATAAKAAPVKQYTIEQFMDTTRIGGSSFSPDEKSILFHSNKSGIFNVYTVPVSGGAAKQLTNSTKESTYVVSYLPTDARIIYSYDRGGNENSHLYLKEADGSERDLTPGDKMKANFRRLEHMTASHFSIRLTSATRATSTSTRCRCRISNHT